MEQIANYILNNGAAVGCLIYFIFRDYKFMNTLTETLAQIKQCLKIISKEEE